VELAYGLEDPLPRALVRVPLDRRGAQGDQWGFRLDELWESEPDPPVWYFSQLTMAVSRDPLGPTFGAYAAKGLVFNARGYRDPSELELKLRFPVLPSTSY
jgi:hypothetical protein